MYDSFTVIDNTGMLCDIAWKGDSFMEKYEAPVMDVEELDEDIITSSSSDEPPMVVRWPVRFYRETAVREKRAAAFCLVFSFFDIFYCYSLSLRVW